jgi:ectoine hydroxylase-related dioxygenase (phytanoyl-CoA dioxygenase family)
MFAKEQNSCSSEVDSVRKRVPHRFRIEGWTYETTDEERTVWSMFDGRDIEGYLERGYVLVPNVLDSVQLKEVGSALERHRQADFGDSRESASPEDSHFQGQYVQNLLLRDPAMSRLLQPEPIVDTVRSLLGPCVMLWGSTGLVSFPGATRTGTDWHADFLVTVSPPPPLTTHIPRVACMVYLDDLDEEIGPTHVVPGSHRWRRVPDWKPTISPPSVALTPTAGSVLFFDAALWHRGGSMISKDRSRRALVFQFVAGGVRMMRERPPRPAQGSHALELVERAEATGDRGMLELLSQVWYG